MSLVQECKDRIEWDKTHNIKGPCEISLVIKGKLPKSGKKKLCKLAGAPTGYVISELDDNNVLVCFNTIEVLRFAEILQNIKDNIENAN